MSNEGGGCEAVGVFPPDPSSFITDPSSLLECFSCAVNRQSYNAARLRGDFQ